MLRAAAAFLACLCTQDPPAEPAARDLPAAAEHDHVHSDDFSQIVAQHSQHEMLEWIARHPWSLGTEVRAFLVQFDASRDLADPAEKDAWFQRGAFLAEVLVHETLTPVLLAALFRTDEQRSQLHTVRAALDELATALGPASVASLRTDLDSLRPPTAPEGGWEACSLELSRVAIAARSAGARELARDLAQEVGAYAAGARDGELALWSARFQGELAREDGDLAVAALRFGEAAEIAGALKDAGTELAILRDAVAAEEVLRLRSPAAELAKDFLGESSKLPRRAAFAAARAGNAADAWRYGEIVRARALARVRGNSEGPPSVEAWRRVLAERESASSDATRDAVLEAQRGVDAALIEAERASPRVAILSGASKQDFDAASAQRQLDAGGYDTLVGYVLGESETLALTMNARGTKAFLLPVRADDIRTRVAALLDPIEAASRGKIEPSRLVFDAKPARELCAQIVDPIASELGPRIGILPDGVLWGIPFEMLVTRAGSAPTEGLRFLVEDHSIAHVPSAAVTTTWLPSKNPATDSNQPHPVVMRIDLGELPVSSELERWSLKSERSIAVVELRAPDRDAVLAVTRGLLAAGSEQVFANRWVTDPDTRRAFEQELAERQLRVPIAEAFRAAQLEVLKSKDARGAPRTHPFFWATWTNFRGL